MIHPGKVPSESGDIQGHIIMTVIEYTEEINEGLFKGRAFIRRSAELSKRITVLMEEYFRERLREEFSAGRGLKQ